VKVLQLVTTERSFFQQQVAALETRGYDCTTVSVPGPEQERRPADFARFYAEVLRTVGREEFDLVHANYGLTLPFAFAQPIRPVVATLWGSDVMSDIDWLVGLTRRFALRCDAVICPSERLSEAYGDENVVVPFGVDTDRFRPMDRASARERVGWPADDRIVLFPYRTDRRVKNFELAKDVAARVDGPVDLRTLSGVAHEEMPYYYNASDAVLVTSRYESGPMVVKEAAACNVPVVSTDVGFAREVLSGVENSAVRVDADGLAAALEAILESGGRSNAREAVREELSVDRMGDAIERVYEGVLPRKVHVRG
jgi:glycosyltransferase involved in cell wall biosynthesis